MMELLGQMIRLPVVVFVTGAEMVLKTVREVQRITDRAIATLMGVTASPRGSETGGETVFVSNSEASGDRGTKPAGPPILKEDRSMRPYETRGGDCDLSGDDVKNITYSIIFMKPDFVTTLQAEQNETIDYSTDGASFAGLKIAEFMEVLKTKGIDKPKEWKKPPDVGYKISGGGKLMDIPTRDRRYIEFNYKVNWRKSKQAAEYEKDTVEALREIRDRL